MYCSSWKRAYMILNKHEEYLEKELQSCQETTEKDKYERTLTLIFIFKIISLKIFIIPILSITYKNVKMLL